MLFRSTLVEGTRHVMQWAETSGVRNVLFVSSGAAIHRDTVYGRAKRLCEASMRSNVKVMRVYSVVGEEMPLNGQYALGKFIYQAVIDKKVRYYGGTAQRSYLYVNDVADWLIAGLNHDGTLFGLDVGGEQAITMAQLAELVGNVCGVPVEKIITEPQREAGAADIYLPEPGFTQQILGVRETVTLEEAIRRTYAHVCHSYLEPRPAVAPFSLFDSGASLHSSR